MFEVNSDLFYNNLRSKIINELLRNKSMVDNMNILIKILQKVNIFFFILQLYVPFIIVCLIFSLIMPNYEYIFFPDFIDNMTNIPIIVLLKFLFIVETVFLQNLFTESHRKKMRRFCFVGTVIDFLFGYIMYVAAIF